MAVFVVHTVELFDVHGLPLMRRRWSVDMRFSILHVKLFANVVVVGNFSLATDFSAALFASR